MESNKHKIILDLSGGTGAWSEPYAEAGYDRRIITLPEWDIKDYLNSKVLPRKVYGVLFAKECTHYTVSGAQYWEEKDKDGRTLEDTKDLTAGPMIIALTQPVFWCIENPAGRLKD